MSHDDLDLNQRGLIGDNQRTALEVGTRATFTVFWALINVAYIALFVYDWATREPQFQNAVLDILAVAFALLALFMSYGAITRLVVRLRTTSDLREGRVEHGEGVVQFRRRSYRARLDSGGALRIGTVLAPGRYDFHFLPRSRWIVSAQSRASAAAGAEGARDALAAAIGAPLPKALRPHAILASIFTVLATIACIPYITGMYRVDRTGVVDGPISFGVVFLLAAVWCWYEAARERDDLRAADALVVEGPIRRRAESSTYYLDAGTISLKVPAATFNAVVDGFSYRVCVGRRSHELLRIDPIMSAPR